MLRIFSLSCSLFYRPDNIAVANQRNVSMPMLTANAYKLCVTWPLKPGYPSGQLAGGLNVTSNVSLLYPIMLMCV